MQPVHTARDIPGYDDDDSRDKTGRSDKNCSYPSLADPIFHRSANPKIDTEEAAKAPE